MICIIIYTIFKNYLIYVKDFKLEKFLSILIKRIQYFSIVNSVGGYNNIFLANTKIASSYMRDLCNVTIINIKKLFFVDTT